MIYSSYSGNIIYDDNVAYLAFTKQVSDTVVTQNVLVQALFMLGAFPLTLHPENNRCCEVV